jgi:hypothetical protein
MALMCCGKKTLDSAWLECGMIQNVRLSIARMCQGQNGRFSIAEMCCGLKMECIWIVC